MTKIKAPLYRKMVFRINRTSFDRLSEIQAKYGFKSNYEIMQYLLHCFFRIAGLENDKSLEPVPDEIQTMFSGFFNRNRDFEFVKPVRHVRNQTPTYKKVVCRINATSYSQLNAICRQYGFRSMYELCQFLAACFLHVADPEIEERPEPLPDEVGTMFDRLSDAEEHFGYVKPKRAMKKARGFD